MADSNNIFPRPLQYFEYNEKEADSVVTDIPSSRTRFDQVALDAFYDLEKDKVRERGLINVDQLSSIVDEIVGARFRGPAEAAQFYDIKPLEFGTNINSDIILTSDAIQLEDYGAWDNYFAGMTHNVPYLEQLTKDVRPDTTGEMVAYALGGLTTAILLTVAMRNPILGITRAALTAQRISKLRNAPIILNALGKFGKSGGKAAKWATRGTGPANIGTKGGASFSNRLKNIANISGMSALENTALMTSESVLFAHLIDDFTIMDSMLWTLGGWGAFSTVSALWKNTKFRPFEVKPFQAIGATGPAGKALADRNKAQRVLQRVGNRSSYSAYVEEQVASVRDDKIKQFYMGWAPNAHKKITQAGNDLTAPQKGYGQAVQSKALQTDFHELSILLKQFEELSLNSVNTSNTTMGKFLYKNSGHKGQYTLENFQRAKASSINALVQKRAELISKFTERFVTPSERMFAPQSGVYTLTNDVIDNVGSIIKDQFGTHGLHGTIIDGEAGIIKQIQTIFKRKLSVHADYLKTTGRIHLPITTQRRVIRTESGTRQQKDISDAARDMESLEALARAKTPDDYITTVNKFADDIILADRKATFLLPQTTRPNTVAKIMSDLDHLVSYELARYRKAHHGVMNKIRNKFNKLGDKALYGKDAARPFANLLDDMAHIGTVVRTHAILNNTDDTLLASKTIWEDIQSNTRYIKQNLDKNTMDEIARAKQEFTIQKFTSWFDPQSPINTIENGLNMAYRGLNNYNKYAGVTGQTEFRQEVFNFLIKYLADDLPMKLSRLSPSSSALYARHVRTYNELASKKLLTPGNAATDPTLTKFVEQVANDIVNNSNFRHELYGIGAYSNHVVNKLALLASGRPNDIARVKYIMESQEMHIASKIAEQRFWLSGDDFYVGGRPKELTKPNLKVSTDVDVAPVSPDGAPAFVPGEKLSVLTPTGNVKEAFEDLGKLGWLRSTRLMFERVGFGPAIAWAKNMSVAGGKYTESLMKGNELDQIIEPVSKYFKTLTTGDRGTAAAVIRDADRAASAATSKLGVSLTEVQSANIRALVFDKIIKHQSPQVQKAVLLYEGAMNKLYGILQSTHTELNQGIANGAYYTAAGKRISETIPEMGKRAFYYPHMHIGDIKIQYLAPPIIDKGGKLVAKEPMVIGTARTIEEAAELVKSNLGKGGRFESMTDGHIFWTETSGAVTQSGTDIPDLARILMETEALGGVSIKHIRKLLNDNTYIIRGADIHFGNIRPRTANIEGYNPEVLDVLYSYAHRAMRYQYFLAPTFEANTVRGLARQVINSKTGERGLPKLEALVSAKIDEALGRPYAMEVPIDKALQEAGILFKKIPGMDKLFNALKIQPEGWKFRKIVRLQLQLSRIFTLGFNVSSAFLQTYMLFQSVIPAMGLGKGTVYTGKTIWKWMNRDAALIKVMDDMAPHMGLTNKKSIFALGQLGLAEVGIAKGTSRTRMIMNAIDDWSLWGFNKADGFPRKVAAGAAYLHADDILGVLARKLSKNAPDVTFNSLSTMNVAAFKNLPKELSLNTAEFHMLQLLRHYKELNRFGGSSKNIYKKVTTENRSVYQASENLKKNFGVRLSNDTNFVYSAFENPTFLTHPLVAGAGQFKVFTTKFLERLFDVQGRSRRELLDMAIMFTLTAGPMAIPGARDLVTLMGIAFQGDVEYADTLQSKIHHNFGVGLATGVTGILLNVDMSKRASIGTAYELASFKNLGGIFTQKMFDFATDMKRDWSADRMSPDKIAAFYPIMPQFLKNLINTIDVATTGTLKNYDGITGMKYDEVQMRKMSESRALNAVMAFSGLKSPYEAQLQRISRMIYLEGRKQATSIKYNKAEIADLLKQGKISEATKLMEEYGITRNQMKQFIRKTLLQNKLKGKGGAKVIKKVYKDVSTFP